MLSMKTRVKKVMKNKWRYLAMGAGFFLLLAPFAFLTQMIFLAIGNTATPTIHTFCYRMPFDWLISGKFVQLMASVGTGLIISVVAIAFVAGPVFCGYICPVGSMSEGVSRLTPLPHKYRLKFKDTKVTSGMRYGFFAGFIAVSAIVGYKLSTDMASICCRYCSSTVMQNFAYALTGNVGAVGYWNSATMIVLFSWLVLGGVLMVGGRGWCLFFCPLGAVSGLAHAAGAKVGLYKTEFNESKCKQCAKCHVTCPMQAITVDRKVERTLCIDCHECVNSCAGDAYVYGRKKNDNN